MRASSRPAGWYGPNYYAAFRRSTVFIDKILKGAKPANLPVEQPTQLDLVVNNEGRGGDRAHRAAEGRADRVIE